MTGDEVRQVFEATWPQEEITRLGQEFGGVQRARKRHWGMFVRAMGLSAGTTGGADQADVLRSYVECAVPHGARSAFDRWVDASLERCLAALAARALAYVRAQPGDRAGPLGGVTDGDMVEATTVTRRDARLEACPGTGSDAAIQGHPVRSVGGGAPVPDHGSPAREHDRRHLRIDASWRGAGLLADRASARLNRLRACDTHGVRVVIRRQAHGKPPVDQRARGQVTQACGPGSALEALLEHETWCLDGPVVAAEVHGGRGRPALPRRLMGVQTPKGSGFFRTHLPPRIGPWQVADRYRGRWEVACRLHLTKSVNRLDASDAERPGTRKTRWQAARLASTLAARLAPTHHVQTRPQEVGTRRTEAPLHPRRLALPLAVSCQASAQAFTLQGTAAQRRGDKIAARLTHAGQDPTWRRRPSVFEPLRGWKCQPRARQKTNGGDVTHHHCKAAAEVDTYDPKR